MLTRRLSTAMTVTGVMLVVIVFTAVLMMADGIRKTLVATGSDDNAIVLRKAANAEISSIISREQSDIIRTLPHIARGSDGKPLVSSEIVVVINLTYKEGGFANVTVRGVPQEGIVLRPQVRLTSGRMFRWGSREIVVGSSLLKRFREISLGSTLKFGGDTWTIVGVMSSDGSGFDSEIWGDVDQLSGAFDRPVFSVVVVHLENPDAYDAFRQSFESDIRLQYLDAKREKQFYDELSEELTLFVRLIGTFITGIFSVGAMIGAMITMYAAVANRTVEIGTLRALGFGRRNILAAFFLESMLLAITGGAAGILLASLLQFAELSVINFSSFAELAFRFSISPAIVLDSLIFSVIMGIAGGFLPAARAARMNIVTALRSS